MNQKVLLCNPQHITGCIRFYASQPLKMQCCQFSKHRPSGPMISISLIVRPCVYVCLLVHVFAFEVPFQRLFILISKVACPKFLEIQNLWGKEMERSGLTFEHVLLKNGLKSPCNFFFFFWQI